MRKLKTKPFGKIEVDESQELTFPNGIFGFENYKKFYILENPESPFIWLQSAEEEGLAFIMIHPLQFKGDYELKISPEEFNEIEIKDKEKELLDFVIVTIPSDPSKMTANLQGPIIININKKLGKQAISLKEEYEVKCPILEEMSSTLKTSEDSKEEKKEEKGEK
ncbi:MAG: flagellar assembly protein FliW [Spirochaetes bacterium]|nr:flagellar assembly protein FliW [Spirochaetota bacterium]